MSRYPEPQYESGRQITFMSWDEVGSIDAWWESHTRRMCRVQVACPILGSLVAGIALALTWLLA